MQLPPLPLHFPRFEPQLPFFLEPLLLIPHYKRRLEISMDGWLRGDDQRLFGPLEQVVAGVVIIGLAWQYPTTQPAPPPTSSTPAHNSSQTPHNSPPGLTSSSDSVHLHSHLPQIDGTAIAAFLLLLNLGLLLLPDELKRNLGASWEVFWPPWQDRSLISTPPAPSVSQRSEPPVVREKETKGSRAQDAADKPSKAASTKDEVNQKTKGEGETSKEDGTREDVAKLKEKEKEREKKRAERKAADAVGKATSTASGETKPPTPTTAAAASGKEEESKRKTKPDDSQKDQSKDPATAKQEQEIKVKWAKAAAQEDEKAKRRAEVAAVAEISGSAPSPRLRPSSLSNPLEPRSKQEKPTKLSHTSSSSTKVANTAAKLKKQVSEKDLKEMQKELFRYRQSEEEAKEAIQTEKAKGEGMDPVEMQVLRVNYEKARTRRKELEVALAGGVADLKNPIKEKGEASKAGSAPPKSGNTPKRTGTPKGEAAKGSTAAYVQSPPTSSSAPKTRGNPSASTSASNSSQSSSAPSPPPAKTTASPTSTAWPTSSLPMTTDTDPLMAGDYRPLKSVLKKSKKKPRQSRNIHHNYFMTMRGHRPSLVPFPHGLHPPATAPRNTLWWDNVPKDADHIMTSPPIAKAPEEGPEGEDNEGRQATEAKGESQRKEKEKEEGSANGEEKRTDKKSGDVKLSSEDKEKLKRREAEMAKAKAATGGEQASKDRLKEKEKEKVMAAEKEKATRKAEAEANAKAMPSAAAVTTQAVDPQIEKATFISQAMLCALVYLVNPQLALVLVGYFVWRYLETTKLLSSAMVEASIPATSSLRDRSSSSRGDDKLRKEASTGAATQKPARPSVKIPIEASPAPATASKKEEQAAIKRRDPGKEPEMSEEMRAVYERLKSLKKSQAQLEADGKLTDEMKSEFDKKRRELEKALKSASAKPRDQAAPVTPTSAKGKEKMTEEMVKKHEDAKGPPSSAKQAPETSGKVRELYERLKTLKKDHARHESEGKMTDELKAKYKKKRQQLEQAIAALQIKESKDSAIKAEDLTPEKVEEMQKAREARRRERARAEKKKLGQGSSGLSPLEKESL